MDRLLITAVTARRLGREQFLERYENACLVLDADLSKMGVNPVVTPSSRTDIDCATGDGCTTDVKALLAAKRVAWIRNSGRNPFSSLVTLGRAKNNDIVITAPGMSKIHAIFSRPTEKGWCIEDRNSTNGTWIDQIRLPLAKLHRLSSGNTLSFGLGIVAVFLTPDGLYDLCAETAGIV